MISYKFDSIFFFLLSFHFIVVAFLLLTLKNGDWIHHTILFLSFITSLQRQFSFIILRNSCVRRNELEWRGKWKSNGRDLIGWVWMMVVEVDGWQCQIYIIYAFFLLLLVVVLVMAAKWHVYFIKREKNIKIDFNCCILCAIEYRKFHTYPMGLSLNCVVLPDWMDDCYIMRAYMVC